MRPLDRLGYLAHSRSPAFARRVDEARRALDAWRTVTTRRFVAYSAGKDSEVLLHLARLDEPDLLAVWADDEYNLPETLAQLDRTPNLKRLAATIWHSEDFTAWADGSARVPSDREWVDAIGNDGVTPWARRHGYDGVALGLRAGESAARRKSAARRGLAYGHSSGIARCCPLAWWSDRDVWAYLVSREIPYNAAYDRLRELGAPPRAQRIGPYSVERALWAGMLGWLRLGWPAEFERFAQAHPEARRYA